MTENTVIVLGLCDRTGFYSIFNCQSYQFEQIGDKLYPKRDSNIIAKHKDEKEEETNIQVNYHDIVISYIKEENKIIKGKGRNGNILYERMSTPGAVDLTNASKNDNQRLCMLNWEDHSRVTKYKHYLITTQDDVVAIHNIFDQYNPQLILHVQFGSTNIKLIFHGSVILPKPGDRSDINADDNQSLSAEDDGFSCQGQKPVNGIINFDFQSKAWTIYSNVLPDDGLWRKSCIINRAKLDGSCDNSIWLQTFGGAESSEDEQDLHYGIRLILSQNLDWSIERLIWIAYLKNNDSASACGLGTLPKDIILFLLKFLNRCFVFDS